MDSVNNMDYVENVDKKFRNFKLAGENAMSDGYDKPDNRDIEKTKLVVAKIEKAIDEDAQKTWLRHEKGQSGFVIDPMIAKGTYTIEEIAEELRKHVELPSGNYIRKVKLHIGHLQHKKGPNGMPPHRLKINYPNNGGPIYFEDSDL